MPGRKPKHLECMVSLNICLKHDTKEALRDLAQQQSVAAGKQVSMSDLIRPMIEAGLARSNDRLTTGLL